MYFAGVDIGSTMTKVVIHNDEILASIIGPSGTEHRKLANHVMNEALKQAGLSLDDISYIVATGYGRVNVPFADKQITEITCHAKGVHYLFPNAKTVIDIGGQDSKGIKLNGDKVIDFVMNNKCAAGTGRFLEFAAESMGISLEEMGTLSFHSQNKKTISSICTIFAQEEIVAHLSEGAAINDIVAGLFDSFATRIWTMVKGIKIEKDVVITGGGAKYPGLVKALENKLGCEVLTPSEPLLTGAIGAALLAKDTASKIEDNELPLSRGRRALEEVTFFTD